MSQGATCESCPFSSSDQWLLNCTTSKMKISAEHFRGPITMRIIGSLAVILLLAATPAALADSIQLSVNTSVVANLDSPNDNYWGEYVNLAGDPIFVTGAGIHSVASAGFSDISLFLPSGSVITSATVSILLPPNGVQGTGSVFPLGMFPDTADPSLPSVAPTFSQNGTSLVFVSPFFDDLGPIINGNEVSTNLHDLPFVFGGAIFSDVVDPGSNWAGWLGGSGQVDFPYTVQLDVSYSPPVPEPSSLILFGTGGIALFGTLRRRIFR
jgi:hypothetical protein